jgi:hypothetical protein
MSTQTLTNPPHSTPLTGLPHVLVVDDDPAIRELAVGLSKPVALKLSPGQSY